MKEAKLTGNLSNTILFKCIRVEGGEGSEYLPDIRYTTTNFVSVEHGYHNPGLSLMFLMFSFTTGTSFTLIIQERCVRHQPQLVIHLQPLSLCRNQLYKNLPSADYNHGLMDWIGRKEDGRSELCSPERLRCRGETSQSRDSTLARVKRISISYEFE